MFIETAEQNSLFKVNIWYRYNRLAEVPESLSRCVLLDEVNIENNLIVQLPDGMLQPMKHLSTVVLSRNAFEALPNGKPDQYKLLAVSEIQSSTLIFISERTFLHRFPLVFINKYIHLGRKKQYTR